jgi:hypothetical protein
VRCIAFLLLAASAHASLGGCQRRSAAANVDRVGDDPALAPAPASGAASPRAEPTQPVDPVPVETDSVDSDRRVVLDEGGTQELLKRRGIEGARYAPPTADEIRALEAALPAALDRESPRKAGQAPLSERARSYLRQYVGYVNRGGQRRIWGNFICRNPFDRDPEMGDYWRKHLLFTFDGGDCFFNVDYVSATRTFLSISINGDA